MKQVGQWMMDDVPEEIRALQSSTDDFVAIPGTGAEGGCSTHMTSGSSDYVSANEDCFYDVNDIDTDVDALVSDGDPVVSSDEECEPSDCGSVGTLNEDLAEFMISENLTRDASNRLLHLLRQHGHSNLPKDCRTLKRTPREVHVTNKCGGQYVYLGVRKCLEMADPCDAFELIINVDGIPVFKSSNVQFWPILCMVNSMQPMIVALYVGSSKPASADQYLVDFVEEMEQLLANGFVGCDGKVTPVILRAFVCDAPARAFIKNVKNHNSLNGCERCVAKGVSINNRTTYNHAECFVAEKRCPVKFANSEYKYIDTHQVGATLLCRITGDCISLCALDYMHLVCLGAVRRMIQFWKKGDKIVRLSSAQIVQISEKLTAARDFIPSEFVRKPRSLIELDRWKATEFRQFLLYTGPVVLKSVLPPQLYQHFLCLSISISILLTDDEEKRGHLLEYAEKLLQYFVSSCETLYGKHFVVYNIHSLLHLCDDVKHFKASLDAVSSFPFENFLQTLKRLIRSPSNPIVQVVKRIQEFEFVNCPLSNNVSVWNRPMKLSSNRRDSVVLLKNGKFAEIVARQDDRLSCKVLRRSCLRPLFLEPCSSDLLDVYVVERSGKTVLTEVAQEDVYRKALKLPYGNGYAIMPLAHSVL